MGATDYDVVVVGAGLGGLSTALHLQRQGVRVALIEKLDRVGGLCGTYRHNGHEFVIACNDFGQDIRRFCRDLNLPLEFKKCHTRIHYGNGVFTMPPTAPTVMRLARHLNEIRAYSMALLEAKRDAYRRVSDLQALVDGAVRSPELRDLLKLPAYLMGITPSRCRVDALNDELQFGDGYWHPMSPSGGPQHVADTLARQFVQCGGTVMLETEFYGWADTVDCKRVQTSHGQLRCQHLVSTQEPQGHYPTRLERGLPISVCGLVLDAGYAFPRKVRTCIYYPAGISEWSEALYRGESPPEFGFHIVKSDLPGNGYATTANVYFYLPKDVRALSALEEKRLETYLLQRLDRMLPGIRRAIKDLHFVLPDAFCDRHHLDGRMTPVIPPAGCATPTAYHPQSGIYLAGAAAWMPGDRPGAALRSGQAVASLIRGTEEAACA